MKVNAVHILSGTALLLFLTALALRAVFPGEPAVWPVIYALPGIGSLLLGIAFRQKQYLFVIMQILFSLFIALTAGELFFQSLSSRAKKQGSAQHMTLPGSRIWWDSSGEKTVVRKGRTLPVLEGSKVVQVKNGFMLFKPHTHGIHRSRRLLENNKSVVSFEAEYTINAHGFRAVPFQCPTPAQPPLLFFGDSFTFGEGVSDDEVYVNLTAEKFRNKRNVFNFAIPGRDPVDFYNCLTDGFLESSGLKGKLNAQAFYLIINEHKYRVISTSHTGRKEHLSRQDRFCRRICYWLKERLLYKSSLCDAVFNGFYSKRYIIFLKRAQQILKEKYDTSLTLLVYPDCPEKMEKELARAGFDLLLLKDRMPGYNGCHARKIDLKYEIPYDGHPLPSTHRLISDAVADHLEKLRK